MPADGIPGSLPGASSQSNRSATCQWHPRSANAARAREVNV